MSNFASAGQREALVEQYGELHTGILDECLGIIAAVANHNLSETEARVKVTTRFEELMQFHIPACHATVAKYLSRIAAERKAEGENRVAYLNKQQQIRDLDARRQKESSEAADRAHRDAQAKEARELQEARDKFEAERRAIENEKNRVEAERSAELERRLLAAVDGEAQ